MFPPSYDHGIVLLFQFFQERITKLVSEENKQLEDEMRQSLEVCDVKYLWSWVWLFDIKISLVKIYHN